jgi:hypothetical protein
MTKSKPPRVNIEGWDNLTDKQKELIFRLIDRLRVRDQLLLELPAKESELLSVLKEIYAIKDELQESGYPHYHEDPEEDFRMVLRISLHGDFAECDQCESDDAVQCARLKHLSESTCPCLVCHSI